MMEQPTRRSKRVRVAVDYARLDTIEFSDCVRVDHKRLARAVLSYGEQIPVENYIVEYIAGHELANHVHSTGFRNPLVIRACENGPPPALGIRLPKGKLTVERIANLVGGSQLISTIDVPTQSEGPVYTMDEWVKYFSSTNPRRPLLNVVSLDLASTRLQKLITVPKIVKELDLVDRAWPPSESPSPKVQLYILMSVAGCFMDFHIDFGGSSVWYHVLSGRKTFLVVPPTRGNLIAFEEWASSDKQASVFFADRVSGCQKLELSAGDTLLLPGGWPHCVVTPLDSVVIGGNFLTGYSLPLQIEQWSTWQMEERLKVRMKFRFPLFKELMWHTAKYYMKLLIEDASSGSFRVQKWERDGIVTLSQWLSSWLGQMRDGEERIKHTPKIASFLLQELNKYLKAECPASSAVDTTTMDMRNTIVQLQSKCAFKASDGHRNLVAPAFDVFDDTVDEDLVEDVDEIQDDDFVFDNPVWYRKNMKKQRRLARTGEACPKMVVSTFPRVDSSRKLTASNTMRTKLLRKYASTQSSCQ